MSAVPVHPDADAAHELGVARLLVGKPERRDEARRLILGVLARNPGATLVDEASELLALFERLSPHLPVGVEVERARDAWAKITGLDDGRLDETWSLVTRNPECCSGLRSELEHDLGRWLRRLVGDLAAEERWTSELRRRLEAVDRLAESAAFKEHFEIALRPAMDELRVVLFERRLAESDPAIEEALDLWQVERAQELLDVLGEPPAGVALDRLADRRRQLEAVDGRRRAVESFCVRLSAEAPLTDWSGLRRHLELLGGARACLNQPMPALLREGLAAGMESATVEIRRFLRDKERAATRVDAVRKLGRKLEGLDDRFALAGLTLDPGQFQAATGVLERAWSRRLRAAQQPEDLEALAQDLASEWTNLAAPLAEACRRFAAKVRALREIWRDVQRGEPFEPLPQGPVPARLKAEHREKSQVDAEIQAALAKLKSTPADARRAREFAERVLERWPDHAQAARLAKAAEREELARELDARIEVLDTDEFDLEAYQEIASWPEAPETHRVLGTDPELLREIHRLLTEPSSSTAEEVITWWTGYADLGESLPDPTVPVLERRLAEETESRRRQAALVLDSALAAERAARSWETLARGLERIVGDRRLDPARELERYHVELARRAQLSRVGELIDGGRFDRARDLLAGVEGDVERVQNLRVRLAIEDSRSRGDLVALATTLQDQWGRARQIYGEEAIETLLGALSTAWEKDAAEPLATLRAVSRRALRSIDVDSEAGRRLASWLEWLELEESAVRGPGILDVGPLLAHLGGLDPDVRARRSGRLVAAWRAAGIRTALAWAFQALPALRGQLFPDDVDPVEEIGEDMRALVAEVAEWLQVPASDSGQGFAALRQAAQSHFQRARRLDQELRVVSDLLDELPFQITRLTPGREFDRALRQADSVVSILDDLERLAASDLRRKRELLESCRARLRELPYAAWRREVAAALERLGPLTRLSFDENRIREAARECGSPDFLHRQRRFAELWKAVRKVADQLEAAGCGEAPVASAISREYWSRLPGIAGILLPESSEHRGSLAELMALFESAERNEQIFREAVSELSQPQREPVIGANGQIDPHGHRDYLALVPLEAPASRRAQWLFESFLGYGERRSLFEKAVEAGLVPSWVAGVLGGLP